MSRRASRSSTKVSVKSNIKSGGKSAQNNIYFAIVKYLEDKSRRVVLSSDIRDLVIEHVDQVDPNKVYDIRWQDGETKSFDGYFAGNVLMLAATLPELKSKANKDRVRLPPNFSSMEAMYGNKKLCKGKQKLSLQEPVVKPSSRQKSVVASQQIDQARKMRQDKMKATIAAVHNHLPFPPKPDNLSVPDSGEMPIDESESNQITVFEDDGAFQNAKPKRKDSVLASCSTAGGEESRIRSATEDDVRNEFEREKNEKDIMSKKSDEEESVDKSVSESDCKMSLDEKSADDENKEKDDDACKSNESNEDDEDDDDEEDDDEDDGDEEDDDDENQLDFGSSASSESFGQILNENKKMKNEITILNDTIESLKEAHRRELNILKGSNLYINNSYRKVKMENAALVEANKTMKEKIKVINDCFYTISNGKADSEEKLNLNESGLSTLPVTPISTPSTPTQKFILSPRQVCKDRTVKKQLTFSCSPRNDDIPPTEHSSPKTKSPHKEKTNNSPHKKKVEDSPDSKQATPPAKNSKVASVHKLQSTGTEKGSKAGDKLLSSYSTKSPHKRKIDHNSKDSKQEAPPAKNSKVASVHKLQSTGTEQSCSTEKGSKAGNKLQSISTEKVRNKIKPSSTEKEKITFLPWMRDVCDNVKKDMKGEQALPVDVKNKDKVVISPYLSIHKKKWDSVKAQKKHTFFVKKLAHAGYGHEGLKQRTVGLPGKKFKDKKVATPNKVNTMSACYLAKLELANPLATGLEEKAIEESRTWMSDKMQDEARPPKVKKPKARECDQNSAASADKDDEDID